MQRLSVQDYDDRGVEAARRVLVEIGQVLGSYRDRFVVIGGGVPRLLLPDGQPPHIGTIDVDLGLDDRALSDGGYVGLVEALEARGYRRGLDAMKRFQLRRDVDLCDGAHPVAVIVDLLMPREASPPKHRPPLLADFAVQKADGVGLALAHALTSMVEGRMPDGRPNRVELRVTTLPAFLVMKGFALVGRDKPKDAYDIYYTIRGCRGGPAALAEDCRPLLHHSEAVRAYGHIAAKFTDIDAFGPKTVALFLRDHGGMGGMDLEQVQTDAFHQVAAWAEALGIKPE